MVFGQLVEDDRRDRERLLTDLLERGVERQQAVLAVDRAEDPFPLSVSQRTRRR